MQPLSLRLRGFRGIRDGLGLDELTLDLERLADGAALVAIAGANGRGKSTVMDNLHPYLTMPSRAAQAGPGGFSYYAQVCLPETEKDLHWAPAGRCYRSQVVLRMHGRPGHVVSRRAARRHRLRWQGRDLCAMRRGHLRAGGDLLHVGLLGPGQAAAQHLPQRRDQGPAGRSARAGGHPRARSEGGRDGAAVEGGAGGVAR